MHKIASFVIAAGFGFGFTATAHANEFSPYQACYRGYPILIETQEDQDYYNANGGLSPFANSTVGCERPTVESDPEPKIQSTPAITKNNSPGCVTRKEFRRVKDGMKWSTVRKITGVKLTRGSISGELRCHSNKYAWFYFPVGSSTLYRHQWNFSTDIQYWYCDWYPYSVGCTVESPL